ncbi:MAG TPA: TonB-dependent receptor [Blastocatellia bacterium]|nr:TonB-dependent receptor [Blastocatellia bacterium]
MSNVITILVCVVCLSAAPSAAFAQSQLGTGSISGTVSDSNGAVISGATVTITNAGTGLVRKLTTGDSGHFSAPALPVGEYAARVEKTGFSTLDQIGLIVNVGGTTTLRLELKPGAANEVVNIVAEQTLDAARTEETTLINRTQINDLPINGRRADQFALLAPGVTREGRFGLLSYRGQSGVFNNFTLEGNDDNQAYFSEARGRTRIASNISADAVQEFQVAQSNFLPEFGRSAGGGINATVRSGSNAFHGDGFWYFRNEAFSARDPLATINPEERRDQFGGSFGGPVVKDKLFFFLNYDQQLRDFPLITEDLSGALTNGLPANATAQDIADFNLGVADLRSRFPNGAPGNTIPRIFNQNLGLAKIDWNASRSNIVSITYNHLNFRGKNAIQTPLVLGNVGRNGSDDVRIQSFNARLTSTITSRLVNEARMQWGRDWEFEFANQPPPQVFVGGFSFGRASFLERPALPDERRLQFVDNLSYVAGRHSLKFGVDINRAHDIIDNPANFGASYNYSNALTYGRDLRNPALKSYTSYTQNFGIPGLTFNTIDYAAFAQDQWKPFNRLTINYGLRYDYQQNPEPVGPNPAIPETQSINKDLTNFGPRIGAAWDLRGNGKTVARGGYGIYYGRTSNGTIFNALTQTGLTDLSRNVVSITLRLADAGSPTYPNILATPPVTVGTSVSQLDSDFKQPRMQEFNIGVEHELLSQLTVSASFVYTLGDRLPVNFDTNLAAPAFTRVYQFPDGSTLEVPFAAGLTRTAAGAARNVNLSRPNPNFGSINVQRSISETYYKALFLEVKRRFSGGLQFNIAYTLAKAENLSGTGNGGGAGAEDPFGGSSLFNQFDLKANRAPAPTDQRHRFVVNGVWNLPELKQGSALARGLLNGYRLSGIFTAESGRPFAATLSLPNIPFTLDGAQYTGFGGILGLGGLNLAPDVPRNSNYGDVNYRIDLRVARDVKLGDKFVVELLGEAFNLFNRSNFNGFNSTLYNAAFPLLPGSTTDRFSATNPPPLATPIPLTRSANFGAPNNDGSQPDGTNARRFQLALRFRF